MKVIGGCREKRMSSHNSHSRGRARVHDTSIGSWSRIESILCSTNKVGEGRCLNPVSQETMDFISACEALHQRLAQGILTGEEIDLIEFSALDLLNNVKPLD
jgi:hypothetical protein